MTLQELTGQESGIIVFPPYNNDYRNRPSVGVYNWSCCGCEDEMLPILFLDRYVGIPWKSDMRLLEQAEGEGVSVDDIRSELPGTIWVSKREGEQIWCETDMDIVIDENNELPLLFVGEDGNGPKEVTPGFVYTLRDGTKIIAPCDWN